MAKNKTQTIIDRFSKAGVSQSEIANALQVERTAVTKWIRRNRIPPWHRVALVAIAELRGVELTIQEVTR
jgi:predicted transcriptional regulator